MGERSSRSTSLKVDFDEIFNFSTFLPFSDHGVKTIGSNSKILRTFASDFDDQAR